MPYEKKCFAFVIFQRQGKCKGLNALTGTFKGCISPLCPALGWIWGSQTQVNGFATDGNGLSVAFANSQVFRFCLKPRVEVQSLGDVCDSTAAQSSEKCSLSGRAANSGLRFGL